MTKQTELKHLLQELEIATRGHERSRDFSTTPDEKARAFHAADAAEKRVFSFFDKLRIELEDSARAYKSLQEQRNHIVKERDEARKAAVEWQNAAQKAKTDLQELAQQVMAMKPTDAVAPGNDLDRYELTDEGRAAGFNGTLTDALASGWTIETLKRGGYIKTRDPLTNEPFNDARARAGDPIEYRPINSINWRDAHFVGILSTGLVVVEVGTSIYSSERARLRMKPKASQQLRMFATVFRQNGTLWGTIHEKASPDGIIMPPGRELIVRNAPVTITVAM